MAVRWTFPSRSRRSRTKSGKIIGASKILRDLTEFNRVKHQIEEQTALLDKTQDAILIFEPEGRIIYWNKGGGAHLWVDPPGGDSRFIDEFIHADAQKFRESTPSRSKAASGRARSITQPRSARN